MIFIINNSWSPDLLEVKNIYKKFNKRIILDKVNLSLNQGEIIGILGPNGAGKTTLLNIIMGFIKEDNGEVSINNEKINDLPVHLRVRKGLSCLTQDINVVEDITVENNIMAVLQLIGKNKEEINKIINEYLNEFNLIHLSKQKASTLSGGERRKLEIILSLITGPLYILFDEPFTGLDPKTISELHKLILILKSKNIGVIIVDHNYTEVMKKTDRIFLLSEGKIFFNGPPVEFANNEDVKKYYLGE